MIVLWRQVFRWKFYNMNLNAKISAEFCIGRFQTFTNKGRSTLVNIFMSSTNQKLNYYLNHWKISFTKSLNLRSTMQKYADDFHWLLRTKTKNPRLIRKTKFKMRAMRTPWLVFWQGDKRRIRNTKMNTIKASKQLLNLRVAKALER